jgi:peptidoglycan/LPS O-acetylase OafA/YrhL
MSLAYSRLMLPSRMPVIRSLTGARFIAALLVVCFHFVPQAPAGMNSIIRNGYLGVPFFFVLSGFILTYNYASDSQQRFGARSFWVARFARIYPIYLVSLVLSLPFFFRDLPGQVPAIGGRVASDSGVIIFFSVTLTHTLAVLDPIVSLPNTPGWTLSIEAFFYLIFPLLARSIARLNRSAALAAGVSMVALLALLDTLVLPALPGQGRLLGMHGRLLWPNHPLAQLPIFLSGAAAARLFIRTRVNRKLASFSGVAVTAVCILLFAGLAADVPARLGMLQNAVATALFSVLIYFLAFDRGMIAMCLAVPAMLVLGEASYALYILQAPLGGYLQQIWSYLLHGNSDATPFRVGIVVVLVAASLLANRYFETHARMRVKAWLTRRDGTTRGAVRPGGIMAVLPLPVEG